MGLFRPYEPGKAKTEDGTAAAKSAATAPAEPGQGKRADRTAATAVDETPARSAATTTQARPGGRKEGPTRSRKEAQAARMERLHPTLTPKQQKVRDRELRAERRNEAWSREENRPELSLMRDYVDARWTFAEFTFPLMILVFAASYGVLFLFPQAVLWSQVVTWGLLALVIADITRMWAGFKREARTRITHPDFRRVLGRMASRMISIRRFRTPPTRIKRGDSY